MFTPEELERRAYLEGDVKLAALYADLIDQDDLIAENERLQNQIYDLESERDDLQTKGDELQEKIERLEKVFNEVLQIISE